ncbi:MAG: NCS2 family permease [Myxococcales bacterium]|nr:NCS2 family permease [Myxococcales bacterium]
MASTLDRWFGWTAAGSSAGTEVRAGVTTFLTMAYILFVNPAILGVAIPAGQPALLTATALAAALGCLVMGLWARLPFALAPGMGLNAYFAFTVVGQQHVPWPTALGAVFLSGVLFVVLSVTGARTMLVRAIPRPLRQATAGGIGLFLAFIGLKNAGVVVAHPATLVTLGDVTGPGPVLFLVGLVVTGALLAVRRPEAILVGIAVVAGLAIASGAPVFAGQAFGGFEGGVVQAPVWPDVAFALDLPGALGLGLAGIVFVFLFVDLFDTAGTLSGLAERSGLADAEGELPRAGRAFFADAVATVGGALLGTSTTTAYIESAAGMEAGGRTGLTAVVVAGCFLLSLVFWPLAGAVPAVATAPALVVVGALMLGSVRRIDWDAPRVAVPAFLTVAGMALTFSIANGIALGLVTWTALHAVTGRARDVHPILYGLTLAIVARYLWLAAG